MLDVRQIAPQISMTEEERDYRMKSEYNTYLDEEAAFLRSLGLLKEETEEMPEVWGTLGDMAQCDMALSDMINCED